MIRSFLLRAGALLALTAGLFACSSMSSQLKSRFAREQGCPEHQVSVREKGGNVYAAHGCGRTTEYVCGAFAAKEGAARSCEERGLARQAPAVEHRRYPDPEPRPLTPPGPLR